MSILLGSLDLSSLRSSLSSLKDWYRTKTSPGRVKQNSRRCMNPASACGCFKSLPYASHFIMDSAGKSES